MLIVCLVLAAWFTASVPVGLVIGKVIGSRDRERRPIATIRKVRAPSFSAPSRPYRA